MDSRGSANDDTGSFLAAGTGGGTVRRSWMEWISAVKLLKLLKEEWVSMKWKWRPGGERDTPEWGSTSRLHRRCEVGRQSASAG